MTMGDCWSCTNQDSESPKDGANAPKKLERIWNNL